MPRTVSRPTNSTKQKSTLPPLPKASTGISGLDEITFGGLPKGRPTLVCGGAGCGKTLLGIDFLVRGATHSFQVQPFAGARLDPKALAVTGIDPHHPLRPALPERREFKASPALRASRVL